MAVEKMYLVNITGRLDYLDDFLEDLINIDQIDQVNALTEIQNRDFSIKASEENIDRIEDFNNLSSFPKIDDSLMEKLKIIEENLLISKKNKKNKIDDKTINEIYSKLEKLISKKIILQNKKKQLDQYYKNYQILNNEDIDIEKIKKLKYFSYRFGEVSKDGRFILKNNYENVPSAIIHIKNNESRGNIYSEYIDEIVAIDESTRELRENTDRLIENEKKNIWDVSLNLDKDYEKSSKEKSNDIYNNIMEEAYLEEKEIKRIFKEKSKNIKDVYDNIKDQIIDEFVEKIKNKN